MLRLAELSSDKNLQIYVRALARGLRMTSPLDWSSVPWTDRLGLVNLLLVGSKDHKWSYERFTIPPLDNNPSLTLQRIFAFFTAGNSLADALVLCSFQLSAVTMFRFQC